MDRMSSELPGARAGGSTRTRVAIAFFSEALKASGLLMPGLSGYVWRWRAWRNGRAGNRR